MRLIPDGVPGASLQVLLLTLLSEAPLDLSWFHALALTGAGSLQLLNFRDQTSPLFSHEIQQSNVSIRLL